MKLSSTESAVRVEQLKQVAEAYFDSLRRQSFETIPFDEKAALRAPLTPGGVQVPLNGKK